MKNLICPYCEYPRYVKDDDMLQCVKCNKFFFVFDVKNGNTVSSIEVSDNDAISDDMNVYDLKLISVGNQSGAVGKIIMQYSDRELNDVIAMFNYLPMVAIKDIVGRNQAQQIEQELIDAGATVKLISKGNDDEEDEHYGNDDEEDKHYGNDDEEDDGTWICEICGDKNNDGIFCSSCGAKKPGDESWSCSTCGRTGLTGKFCTGCGSPMLVLYDIKLVSAGVNQVSVIKVVREYMELGLRESKDLVDSAPNIIAVDAEKDAAEKFQKALSDAGAVVELIRKG